MDIKILKDLGTIIEYNKVIIEVKQIECSDGSLRYDIRKYSDVEHQFRGISLEEEAAKNLFVLLGKEFGYIAQDTTVESLEKTKGKSKSAFSVTAEQKQKINLSAEPVSTTDFLKIINKVIDKKTMKSLSVTNLNTWLLKKGFVSEDKVPAVINRTVRKLTEESANIGLVEEQLVNEETGEITKEIRFTHTAQKYTIDNLDEIINIR